MEIQAEQCKNVTIVPVPVQELDAGNAGELKRAIAPVLESSMRVVLDLSRLDFVDSSGLGAILSCLRQLAARGGDLKLCCTTKHVRAAMELVRMHRIFAIYDSREDAVAAFGV
jgi:anti-sigma B factor antagonist